jgi:hypothetical protein
MTLIEKLKLLAKLNSTVNEVEKGIQMKDSTKVILVIITFLTGLAQMKFMQDAVGQFLTAHAAVATIIGGIVSIALALHVPVKQTLGALVLAVLLLSPGRVLAQAAPATSDAPIQTLYAGGISYNVGASPAIAGTGLYAHELNASGTYLFTAIDALPNTYKPFTVGTNVGAGIAQKVATLGKIPIYVPTAAGISWSGGNTGWQWNGGALASFHIKGNYYLMPSVRFLKSSVSDGSGYQPIIGVLFGWGQ